MVTTYASDRAPAPLVTQWTSTVKNALRDTASGEDARRSLERFLQEHAIHTMPYRVALLTSPIDDEGNTALHLATRAAVTKEDFGPVYMIADILNIGLDPYEAPKKVTAVINARNNRGATPLSIVLTEATKECADRAAATAKTLMRWGATS